MSKEINPSENEIISMLDKAIPPEVMEVINFISDREVFYQDYISANIKKEIQEKYGEDGLKIYNDLNLPANDGNEECKECGASPEEILNDEVLDEEESSPIPDFVMDQICEDVIESSSFLQTITCKQILSSIKKIYPEYLDFVIEDDISNICKTICFKGISDGWLMDEIFDLEDIPKEIQERSKNRDEVSKREIELLKKEDEK